MFSSELQQVLRNAAPLIVGAAAVLGGVGDAMAQGLPGGATSLHETHGDWTVNCAVREDGAQCSVSQNQINGSTQQRVLSIELVPDVEDNTVVGTLVMPFGLAVGQDVILSMQEGLSLPPLRFATCLPVGCLVRVAFSSDAIAAMKGGTTLEAKATASSDGQDVSFSISLAGFSSALERAAAIEISAMTSE